jgi:hypothetical protein
VVGNYYVSSNYTITLQRVVGNYYVSADKVQRLASSSADGAKDADKLSDSKLRQGQLTDKENEHPLPSVPGFSRKITFDEKDQVRDTPTAL